MCSCKFGFKCGVLSVLKKGDGNGVVWDCDLSGEYPAPPLTKPVPRTLQLVADAAEAMHRSTPLDVAVLAMFSMACAGPGVQVQWRAGRAWLRNSLWGAGWARVCDSGLDGPCAA